MFTESVAGAPQGGLISRCCPIFTCTRSIGPGLNVASGSPSQRSMKRARLRIKALTGRSQVGMELPVVIGGLNLFLVGWGNDFRTGNAADKFTSMDRYVAWRLKRFLIKKRGRN